MGGSRPGQPHITLRSPGTSRNPFDVTLASENLRQVVARLTAADGQTPSGPLHDQQRWRCGSLLRAGDTHGHCASLKSRRFAGAPNVCHMVFLPVRLERQQQMLLPRPP